MNSIDPSQVTINPNFDRLYKVRKLLDIICPKFESAYTTHQEVSIDEAMIPFQGRLSFKQYMKDKPTKWGIKAFVLCDARMVIVIVCRYIQVKMLKLFILLVYVVV